MESAPATPAVDSPSSSFARRAAAALLLAAVALWLFSGQGGLAHPVQLAARGCVIGALALVLCSGNIGLNIRQLVLLAVFCGWALLAAQRAACGYLALQEILTWVTAIAAVVAGQAVFPAFPARRWWLVLVWLLGITALPEFLRNLAAFGGQGLAINVIGLPGNSNVLGVILAACLPAVVAALAEPRDRRWALLTLPLLLAGLLMTYSRNAWLTAVVGLGIWWYLQHRGSRIRMLWLMLVLLALLLLIPATRDRMHSFIDPHHPSNLERFDLFRSVGKWLGEDNNLWRGGGMGQWGFIYPRLATGDKWQLHTHNVISEWLIDGGVPLAALGLLLLVSGFWGRISDAERTTETVRRAQLAVLVLANQFDYLLWIPLTTFLLFAVLVRKGPTAENWSSTTMLQALLSLVALNLFLLLYVAGIVLMAEYDELTGYPGWLLPALLLLFFTGMWLLRRRRPGLTITRQLIAGGSLVILVVTVVIPGYAYGCYVDGLACARQGDWATAEKKFAAARWGLHPVYGYYQELAHWRMRRVHPDGDRFLGIMANDPYLYGQFADMVEMFGGDGGGYRQEMERLDPQQWIAGGEEFPQRAVTPCPPPGQMANWEQLPEGDLLNCARNWGDSFPAEAERAYRLSLHRDPRWATTYAYFGEFLARQQRWQDAVDALQPVRAVQGKRPEDAAAICEVLAQAYAALGNGEEAERYRRAAVVSREQMITRHAQVIRMMFRIPTLPREGFNDN